MNKTTELPPDWRWVALGDKFTFTSKPTRLRLENYASIPFVSMESIPTGKLFFSNFNRKAPEEISSGTYFEEGDFLLSKITPCFENGKQGIIRDVPGGFGIATTEVIPIKASSSDSYLPFLAMLLRSSSIRAALAEKMEGATGRQRLAKSVLHNWQIPFPPLDQQRRIVQVVEKIQTAIQLQEQTVTTLQELKAATMAKLFREGLRGEPLKPTEIGDIPKSWELLRLDCVASIERGKFAHRPRNDPDFYGGSIPFIQTGDVSNSDGRIRSYSQTLNEEGLAISRIFPRGTIVLTIAANIGDTAILDFDSAFPDSLVGITPDHTMDAPFLAHYLRTQKSEMDRLAPKGTQKNINLQFLKPWRVPRPSLEEQRTISGALESLDKRLVAASSKRAHLKDLFCSMLDLLMTGQVRVQTTNHAL